MAETLVMDSRNVFRVVVTDEAAYEIWPAQKPVPAGWITVGVEGSMSTCMQHIARSLIDGSPRAARSA